MVRVTRSTKVRKLVQRAVVPSVVPLHRQIGAVQLQKESVPHDGLVFDAQGLPEGGEVFDLGRVVVVAHRGGDDPRRGRGQERFGEGLAHAVERGAEVGAFALDRGVVLVADVADGGGQSLARADPHLVRHFAGLRRLEDGIAVHVAARRASPGPAEAGHAAADVEEEGLALLLAVVADVDAGVALFADGVLHRGMGGGFEFGVHGLARRLADVEFHERGRARQAAGVGGEDSRFAAAHLAFPPVGVVRPRSRTEAIACFIRVHRWFCFLRAVACRRGRREGN